MEKFHINKLSKAQVKQKYQMKMWNRFAVLENPEEITENSEIYINNSSEIVH